MLELYGEKLNNRLILGTARYPSPKILEQSIQEANIEVVTVSLRRETSDNFSGNRFFDFLKTLNVKVLPNTAGCHTVKEAITTAHMAREVFGTTWIKLEVIGNDHTLQPDPFKTLEAAKILNQEGFNVFPYTTDDLILATKLYEVGCKVIMPLASHIGTGQGIVNPYNLSLIRNHLKDATLIVDAGIGRPSDAAIAMELGYDAVLLNTAVALSFDPVKMAKSFYYGVKAGRGAYLSGIMPKRQKAEPSTPVVGLPFLDDNLS